MKADSKLLGHRIGNLIDNVFIYLCIVRNVNAQNGSVTLLISPAEPFLPMMIDGLS